MGLIFFCFIKGVSIRFLCEQRKKLPCSFVFDGPVIVSIRFLCEQRKKR
ncbi:hypothetical protein LEP1GSC008_3497 [Leptospira kirschneri serovar Bulgarica str. Nikolaevo]|uniref:Uncharacterized protein n=1 Tax=Leptospira kirschneri serovar Bulgarica str. Nikolaevo TaxID=1240687 RepID=M6F9F6_9LEPT|nr:hypothetical protein LEP1GSC008_3497 [Leptospira kirschneri serovar Bulgarica str. Nikolaevo]